jgi:hypothetical protein
VTRSAERSTVLLCSICSISSFELFCDADIAGSVYSVD